MNIRNGFLSLVIAGVSATSAATPLETILAEQQGAGLATERCRYDFSVTASRLGGASPIAYFVSNGSATRDTGKVFASAQSQSLAQEAGPHTIHDKAALLTESYFATQYDRRERIVRALSGAAYNEKAFNTTNRLETQMMNFAGEDPNKFSFGTSYETLSQLKEKLIDGKGYAYEVEETEASCHVSIWPGMKAGLPRYEFYLLPDKGYRVSKCLVRDGNEVFAEFEVNYQEVAPGMWFPAEIIKTDSERGVPQTNWIQSFTNVNLGEQPATIYTLSSFALPEGAIIMENTGDSVRYTSWNDGALKDDEGGRLARAVANVPVRP